MNLLVVCGLKAEADIVAADGVRCLVGGGRADALRQALEAALDAERPAGVLSFGVAGALSPELKTGAVVAPGAVAHAGRLYDSDPPWREALARKLKALDGVLAAAPGVVGRPSDKARLRREASADLVDMESGVVAAVCRARGVPFAVLRAVADDANTALPPSAVAGMGPDGEVRVGAVLLALAGRPHDLPGLIRAGRDSARAFEALRRARAEIGPDLAFAS